MSATTLYNPRQGYEAFKAVWAHAKALLEAGHRLQLSVKPEKRSTEQNARMWASLQEVATQVEWHGQHLTKEEWKDVFTACLKRQKVVPGLDGGFVVLGSSTSRMSKHELSELLECIYAFGAQRGVNFKEPQ
jgi:hypothetical protein